MRSPAPTNSKQLNAMPASRCGRDARTRGQKANHRTQLSFVHCYRRSICCWTVVHSRALSLFPGRLYRSEGAEMRTQRRKRERETDREKERERKRERKRRGEHSVATPRIHLAQTYQSFYRVLGKHCNLGLSMPWS